MRDFRPVSAGTGRRGDGACRKRLFRPAWAEPIHAGVADVEERSEWLRAGVALESASPGSDWRSRDGAASTARRVGRVNPDASSSQGFGVPYPWAWAGTVSLVDQGGP